MSVGEEQDHFGLRLPHLPQIHQTRFVDQVGILQGRLGEVRSPTSDTSSKVVGILQVRLVCVRSLTSDTSSKVRLKPHIFARTGCGSVG